MEKENRCMKQARRMVIAAALFAWAAFPSSFGVISNAGAAGPIIDVEKEGDRRITIGIDTYKELTGDLGVPPGDILAFDLELSGWFEPIRPGVMAPNGTADWARKGAEVVAEMSAAPGGFIGRVRDSGTGNVLLEKTYASSEGSMRRRMHRFADDIVQTLTGEKGIAATQIVCEWNSGKGKRIVRMDIDGYGMKEVTGEGAIELSPRWSSDGSKLTYTSFSSGYPDVYLQDLKGGNRKRIAHYQGLNAFGDLHPNGNLLVLTMSSSGDPEIYTKDLSSGKIHRLTHHKATDTSPVWSPDGSRIAFVSDRTGGPQVYVMNADGSSPKQVTLRGDYNTAPEWSPDGTRIAYCALRPDGFQIQVVELASGGVTTITEGGGCEDPCWSPDGRSILYSRSAGGRTDLYVTDLSERKALRITRGSGKFTTPDWSPIP
jgi:TolB protein